MVQRFQCIQIVFCSPSSPTKLSMATSLSRCTPVIDFPRGSSRRHFSRFILWLQVLPLRVPPSSIFFFWLCKIHCLPSLELPKHWNFCRVRLLLAKCTSILKSSPVRVKLQLLLNNSDRTQTHKSICYLSQKLDDTWDTRLFFTLSGSLLCSSDLTWCQCCYLEKLDVLYANQHLQDWPNSLSCFRTHAQTVNASCLNGSILGLKSTGVRSPHFYLQILVR